MIHGESFLSNDQTLMTDQKKARQLTILKVGCNVIMNTISRSMSIFSRILILGKRKIIKHLHESKSED
ncbi:hypothetical protein J2W41_003532 [Bacillus pumilus]|nr:hypothetical protein [Bacillus pumilus]